MFLSLYVLCFSVFIVDVPWFLWSHSSSLTQCLLEQSRLDILKIHSRKMNLMRGIDLKKIAEKMGGASGAELKVLDHSFPFCILFYFVLNTENHFQRENGSCFL